MAADAAAYIDEHSVLGFAGYGGAFCRFGQDSRTCTHRRSYPNGLENIVVETTMQDKAQFYGMRQIIEDVVSKLNSNLNIFILKVGEFDDVTSDSKNIKIHNL